MALDDYIDIKSLQDIYYHWYDGIGPCEGCPKRDADHVTDPYFGFSNHPSSADVVILGESPGGRAEDAPAAQNGSRVWKDYTDVVGEVPEEYEHSRNEFSIGELEDCGNYGDWRIFHKTLDEAWKANSCHYRDIQIYYTNHTKCPDIHIDGYNHDSTDCPRYLIPELQFWEPNGIIVFHGPRNNGNHLHDALRDLGVSNVPDDNVDRRKLIFDVTQDPPFRRYWSDILDATVICSYHWGQDLAGNGSPAIEELAANHELDGRKIKTGSGFKQRYAHALSEALINEIG